MTINYKNIYIVLIETKESGNIGAVVRAMKNMGLTNLCLVAPYCSIDSNSHRLASGADDILEQAKTFNSLDEAMMGKNLIVGTTARPRALPHSPVTPRHLAKELINLSQANKIAILFGPEDKGLNNQMLSLCDYIVNVPTSRGFSSLNLAQAVMIIAYELQLATTAKSRSVIPAVASFAEKQQLHNQLKTALVEIGFLNPQNPEHIMKEVAHILSRARLTTREVNILRGLVRQLRWYSKNKK